ncbi:MULTISPECIES: TRAP transporter large permease [unclassified Sulfitobacter]|jgi:tripartite ATP-independent transporter DctM subunit|uniref:TRAP transporter large permease n=1 Tax=unclassified Sulfitobacter TaxID=196795 RepID=UPI0004E3BEFF|nr:MULTISPECIES: TRAP transporter large permease [unclassified Sulfitobacter]PTB00472.1 TRAP transporter large permease [Sulfitobacter sp. CB-A]ULO20281.1 TRAP transporter large permease [Sulfitobacter sp. CB2047]
MVYIILIAGLLIGVPIAFAILASLSYFMAVGEAPYTLRIVATELFNGLNSYPLLAIPLFVLAGELMNESGITGRIIAFANVLVGRMRAGLAMVNIWASVIFAGLSGSAVADTSAIGRVFIPEMEKHGYDRAYAAALTAASSVIGPIIPPSIPVIIYALIVTGVSVPALFMAGVIPGLLLAVFLSAYVMLTVDMTKIRQAADDMPDAQPAREALLGGILPLLMPVFVVGSILLGVVTPTEAASFAVAYALVVGLFIYRKIAFKRLPIIFTEAMRDSAVILIIIAAVSAANWLLAYNRVPNMLTDWVLGNVDSKTTFLIAVILLFLFVGLFLEGIAAMLVLVPILHPIAVSLGIDPVHFGILVIFNLMIGLITPPLGLCLFVAEGIAGVGMARMVKAILPFFLVEVLVLLVLTFVPQTVIWLPQALGY